MSSVAPAQNIVTADNFGPAVNILNWFLTVTTALAVIARVLTKLNYSRFGSDDIAILLALSCSIGLSIAASFQELYGLGRRQATLSPDQLESYQKATYAADILFISTLLLSKLSVVLFLQEITPMQFYRRLNFAIGICSTAWGISGILAAAFQCTLPHPWEVLGDKCFDQVRFRNYLAISNILLELALVALPISIFGRIQTSLSRKSVILGCFTARVLVIAAIVMQVVYFDAQTSSNDRTFNIWQTTIAAFFVESLSIITASIPGLKPFLRTLETGMIRSDDLQRRRTGSLGYPEGKTIGGSTDSKGSSSGRHLRLQKFRSFPLHGQNEVSNTAKVTGGHRKKSDAESQSSQSNIIRQERTWTVESSP